MRRVPTRHFATVTNPKAVALVGPPSLAVARPVALLVSLAFVGKDVRHGLSDSGSKLGLGVRDPLWTHKSAAMLCAIDEAVLICRRTAATAINLSPLLMFSAHSYLHPFKSV